MIKKNYNLNFSWAAFTRKSVITQRVHSILKSFKPPVGAAFVRC